MLYCVRALLIVVSSYECDQAIIRSNHSNNNYRLVRVHARDDIARSA